MFTAAPSHLQQRMSLVRWTARMGAVTADALAAREGTSVASARARAVAAERDGLVVRRRPLASHPALYVTTRAGLQCSGLQRLGPCRISASNAMHAIVCAGVAAVLEGGYPDQRLLSERELRREEIDLSAPLASARLPDGPPGARRVHRPDLALCPRDRDGGLPVAVEVELTIKAPRRLATICRAWSRTRNVSGVIYVAPPDVQRALQRAIDTVQGEARIVVVPLHALADGVESMGTPPMGTIPIDA